MKANEELAFQNVEKAKRAAELVIANIELAFQNAEKEKRAAELVIAKEEKAKRAAELVIASEEKEKRAAELVIASEEKEKRAAELVIANEEKEKRAAELITVKVAAKAAELANAAKSNFLTMMSHELRTPMNGVLGAAQILKHEDLNQSQNDWCDIIIVSGNALVQILTDILDLSKIEAGKESVNIRPFSLRKVIEINAALFLGAAMAKNITLTWEADSMIRENLIGDPDLLSKVDLFV
ncbi:MAG: histidine kinase dimerization/phospho-acceptor domain-containing protein [SAR324 cluster bacterium]|nr:histidine kinase dimerization/phospho-acceptor domain-containing protein [SAR324 cluster bacterium]